MPVPLILAGLSLLPKIPQIWGTVAGLFGKKVPDSIEAAGILANDVMSAFQKDEISPEVKVKLEQTMNQHKEKIAEIALEEKRIEYDLMKGSQQVSIEQGKSSDQYVRRTRPKILRDMFKLCAAYTLFAPLVVVAVIGFKATEASMASIISLLEYIAGFIYGTFTVSFTGYVTGRTLEKKKGMSEGIVSNSLMSTIGSLIKK